MRFRIIKRKRFFKPYEIEVAKAHKKYISLHDSNIGRNLKYKFWSELKAREYVYITFVEELDDGAIFINELYKER